MSDDEISEALSEFQTGPKSRPLTSEEYGERVEALRRFTSARLAHLRAHAMADQRVLRETIYTCSWCRRSITLSEVARAADGRYVECDQCAT